MKHKAGFYLILAMLLLHAITGNTQSTLRRVTPSTTEFTRQLLTNETSAGARSALGVSAGGGGGGTNYINDTGLPGVISNGAIGTNLSTLATTAQLASATNLQASDFSAKIASATNLQATYNASQYISLSQGAAGTNWIATKANTNAPTLWNPIISGTISVGGATINSWDDVTNYFVQTGGGGGGGLTYGDLAVTNLLNRVLVSDTSPQDPFRWINNTNGVTAYPAWVSTRIVGSLTPGIHFYNITNGADEFSIDVQHDHAAAGKSEARMIARWDMAIVPGYNSRVQLGASTDNWGNSIDVQYGNRMGWSHLFNLWGNTNSNIGALSMQGRRISTSTNLNELWIWASEPTWNSYPTPGFSTTGPQIAKLAIGGTYFYTDLWTPRTIVTNRQLIGAGPMFYTTDGGLELSSGYSDGFMVGADLSSATRTTGASKYFWMTMTPKTHGNPRLNIQSVANDSSSTATLYIGGGSGSATAPMNSVKIYAGSDSTTLGTGVLSVNVTPGLVTVSNLTADGVITGNGSGLTNVNETVETLTYSGSTVTIDWSKSFGRLTVTQATTLDVSNIASNSFGHVYRLLCVQDSAGTWAVTPSTNHIRTQGGSVNGWIANPTNAGAEFTIEFSTGFYGTNIYAGQSGAAWLP